MKIGEQFFFSVLALFISVSPHSSLAQTFIQKSADPLIEKMFVDIEKQFLSACTNKICRTDEFLKQMPIYRPELKSRWLKRWRELSHLDPAVGARTWMSEIYLNLKVFLPPEAQSADLRVATIIWIVLHQLVTDLNLPESDPAFLTVMSEVQYRSLIALQLEHAWELSENIDKEHALNSIDGLRLLLGKAQLLNFFGSSDSAYALLEKILRSEVFKSSEVITSKLHRVERGWAWFLLAKTAHSMGRPGTAAVIKHISAEKIYADHRQKNLQWWWEAISKMRTGEEEKVELKDNFILADQLTQYFWDFLITCQQANEGSCDSGAALEKTETYLNKINPGSKLTYIQ